MNIINDYKEWCNTKHSHCDIPIELTFFEFIYSLCLLCFFLIILFLLLKNKN